MKALLIAALLFAQPSVETKQVRSIKFENFEGVSNDEVMHRLKDRGIRIMVEQLYEPQQVESAREVLQELLEEKGRRNASVKSIVRPVPGRSVEVTFKAINN